MTWDCFASSLLGSGIGIVLYLAGGALVRRRQRARALARRWKS